MIEKIIALFKHKLVQSSGLILSGSLIANVLNYAFNLIMGRMLDPVAFGEMAALVTLFMIVAVPASTITFLLAKYTAQYQATDDLPAARLLYEQVTKQALLFGSGLVILFWVVVPVIQEYLHTTRIPLVVFAVILLTALLGGVSRGTVQGLHRFGSLAASMIVEAFVKLSLSVLFVYLGLSVTGVILALLAASIVSYLYMSLVARKYIPSANTKQATDTSVSLWSQKNIIASAKIIFWSNLFLAVFSNIDVILAKHYLPEWEAGQYAALAIIGRIIAYGSTAVVGVMVPMVAAAHQQKNNSEQTVLRLSLVLVGTISAGLVGVYALVPELVVKLLFGSEYLSVAPLLWMFGAVMLFGALSKVLINYFMTLHRTKFLYVFLAAIVIQVGSIVLFHSSIAQIVYGLLVASGFLVCAMTVVWLRLRQLQQVA